MARLSITILVPTYNRPQFLAACLKSLLQQTRPADQLLVIDDGSEADTTDVLHGFTDKVGVLRTPQVGRSAALNAGLEQVRGDCVWTFDDDDIALPDALERFVEPLEADTGVGFSFSYFWYTRSRRDGSLGRPYDISHRPDLVTRGPLVPLLEANYLGGAALFARTQCYREVGSFDPALIRSQDYEMAIRIVRRFRGVPVRGGPTFHYRQHGGPRGRGVALFAEHQRNDTWLAHGRIFFRRLYRDLPLSDYVPPGTWRPELLRTALLQRCAVMATKDLVDEVLADLSQVASSTDPSPLTQAEVRIVAGVLLRQSWNGHGMLATPGFGLCLRQLAARSPVLREIACLARRRVCMEMLATLRVACRGTAAGHFGILAGRLGDLGQQVRTMVALQRLPEPPPRS